MTEPPDNGLSRTCAITDEALPTRGKAFVLVA